MIDGFDLIDVTCLSIRGRPLEVPGSGSPVFGIGTVKIRGFFGVTCIGIEAAGKEDDGFATTCRAVFDRLPSAPLQQGADRFGIASFRRGLLYDMGQLMGQELPTRCRPWPIFPKPKNNVLPRRESLCIDSLCRLRRLCAGMNPNLAEIISEAWLKEGPFCRRQWLPAPLSSMAEATCGVTSGVWPVDCLVCSASSSSSSI